MKQGRLCVTSRVDVRMLTSTPPRPKPSHTGGPWGFAQPAAAGSPLNSKEKVKTKKEGLLAQTYLISSRGKMDLPVL